MPTIVFTDATYDEDTAILSQLEYLIKPYTKLQRRLYGLQLTRKRFYENICRCSKQETSHIHCRRVPKPINVSRGWLTARLWQALISSVITQGLDKSLRTIKFRKSRRIAFESQKNCAGFCSLQKTNFSNLIAISSAE